MSIAILSLILSLSLSTNLRLAVDTTLRLIFFFCSLFLYVRDLGAGLRLDQAIMRRKGEGKGHTATVIALCIHYIHTCTCCRSYINYIH